MISVVLDVVGAVLLLIGLTLMTIGVVGVLRMPNTYAQSVSYTHLTLPTKA